MSAGRPKTRGRKLEYAVPKVKARAVCACSNKEEGNNDGKEENTGMKVDGVMPHEEQDTTLLRLERGPVRPFWEFEILTRTMSNVDPCVCIVLAPRLS